jgi:hypothetical protein
MAHNENSWCLIDWDDLENPANKTRGFLAGVPKESHRLVARNPACGLVCSCYCEHVASLSRSRRVFGSLRVVLCDTPGWETLPFRIRSTGFEAHSGGLAFNAGDRASRKRRKRRALPLQRPRNPLENFVTPVSFHASTTSRGGARLGARAKRWMPYWEATFDKQTFGISRSGAPASDTTLEAGSIPRPDAFKPPVARTDDGDHPPAAVRSLAQTPAVVPVDDPECPSPAKGASCSRDSNPRKTGRAGRVIPR